MRNSVRISIKHLIFISFFWISGVFLPSSVWAADCGVPVCDVAAYLDELRASPTAQREQKILRDFPAFAHENRKSQDVAVWSNLTELAQKTYDLAIELQDADYIVREAQNLKDISNLNLHRFGPPTVENLISTYKNLSSAGYRFQALETWSAVEKEESVEKAQVLVEFARLAMEYSLAKEDADWVVRKAQEIMRSASARVVALDPIVEGFYQIRLIRTQDDSLICPEYKGTDTLMIANWLTSEGLVAEILGSGNGTPLAYFKNMVISDGGTRIRVKSLSSGTSVRMSLDLDKSSGRITGKFTSTRVSCTYNIEGQRIHSPGLYMRDGSLVGMPEEINLQTVSGVYDVIFSSELNPEEESKLLGRMVIRPHRQPNGSTLAATYLARGFDMDFQYGYFSADRAFMIMNSGTGEKNLVRWDLAFRPDARGEWAWRGRMYSFYNGKTGYLKLKKIANYDEDPDDFEL